ncbi:MAG: family 78 glycoside hydrolase catalytic domain, partial [Planctomycetota bacterium]
MFWRGKWIWTQQRTPKRNAFVGFRRFIPYRGGPAVLHITADSRYMAYINGHYLGHGPVRAWPWSWRYDSYDLAPYLAKGENVLAVLVNHYGEGTFQYVPGPPGLLAQVEMEGATVCTNASWRAAPDPAFASNVPRISVQEAFEEQFDGREADAWTSLDYEDASWPAAVELRPVYDGHHEGYAPRGIPSLTVEPVLPRRLVSVERIRSIPHRYTVYAKPCLVPGDRSSNVVAAHAYLATQVLAPEACEVAFHLPHKCPGPIKVNGALVEDGRARLRQGWNSVVADIRGIRHLHEFVVALDGPPDLEFSAAGDQPFALWAVVGPFPLSDAERQAVESHMDASLVVAEPRDPDATLEAADAFWQRADLAAELERYYVLPVRPEHIPPEDVFVQAYTDRVVEGDVRVEGPDGLVSGSEWTTVHPPEDGSDVRLLLDFGKEVVGHHRFEVMAPEGTVVDLHNFEFIQPDGRINLAEGMNNACRYICRDGRQSYQTLQRRGFQYSYLILRNLTGPVRLRGVQAVMATYPQSRRGAFACSDAQLDRIWEVGAHSLRCCAEDTYTDCPTYEQTHWVGDARNEALIDWVINGDRRLWFRCLEQAGQSLERSPLTESHAPSAWQNNLPAWSFLWMRSCREYLLFTGDREGARRLLEFVRVNVEGIVAHVRDDGLFAIRGWNMFDWAAMDTPSRGVVTHLNCMAVHA